MASLSLSLSLSRSLSLSLSSKNLASLYFCKVFQIRATAVAVRVQHESLAGPSPPSPVPIHSPQSRLRAKHPLGTQLQVACDSMSGVVS